MNILYVARFGPHGNQDEEAVADALAGLGHSVTRVRERPADRTPDMRRSLHNSHAFDLCLFHKWDDRVGLASLRCPSAFWYFDLVVSDPSDPTLAARTLSRRRWMRSALSVPRLVAGFCTDGDWAIGRDPCLRKPWAAKLVWLPQGADGRLVGPGVPDGPGPDVLFVGSVRNTGRERRSHVDHLRGTLGDRFHVVGDRPGTQVHGRRLADMLCSAKVVVAPDSPCSDRYWSNRVYLVTGFGGLLLHPRCRGLDDHFSPSELVQYRSRDDLDELVDYALAHPDWRETKSAAGYRRTVANHLYRHRLAEMFDVLRTRL